MIHIHDDIIRGVLLKGNFGLEREMLRVTEDGRLSHTAHPFPDEKRIVRDFCENQTELNTSVHDSVSGAMEELRELDGIIRARLGELPEKELLWPFSNPPYIEDEADIPVAEFTGVQRSKTVYRDYLSGKYGRYKMTLCGIHINFSFTDDLIGRECILASGDMADIKNRIYLDLAAGLMEYGWILTALTAASPLLDGSFLEKGRSGETVFTGMSSYRCGDNGYWNDFVPVLDYSSIEAYAGSIRAYIEEGLLNSPSELYYPIRLKSEGVNDLDVLTAKGVDHIELRMFDLDPLLPLGLDERDVIFAHLLMVWIASREISIPSAKDQIRTAGNYKRAARYDLDTVSYINRHGISLPMRRAAILITEQMEDFYREYPNDIRDVIRFEREKLIDRTKSYSYIVRQKYGDMFSAKAIAAAVAAADELAKERR